MNVKEREEKEEEKTKKMYSGYGRRLFEARRLARTAHTYIEAGHVPVVYTIIVNKQQKCFHFLSLPVI